MPIEMNIYRNPDEILRLVKGTSENCTTRGYWDSIYNPDLPYDDPEHLTTSAVRAREEREHDERCPWADHFLHEHRIT